MDRVLLVGAEEVASAGRQMREAAAEMNRAAGNMEASVQELKRFMDDWLNRLENIFADDERKGGI
jgi:hypothetical protein